MVSIYHHFSVRTGVNYSNSTDFDQIVQLLRSPNTNYSTTMCFEQCLSNNYTLGGFIGFRSDDMTCMCKTYEDFYEPDCHNNPVCMNEGYFGTCCSSEQFLPCCQTIHTIDSSYFSAYSWFEFNNVNYTLDTTTFDTTSLNATRRLSEIRVEELDYATSFFGTRIEEVCTQHNEFENLNCLQKNFTHEKEYYYTFFNPSDLIKVEMIAGSSVGFNTTLLIEFDDSSSEYVMIG